MSTRSLTPLVLLVACARPEPTNEFDIDAAAERAQHDIATYSAQRNAVARAAAPAGTPTVAATPLPVPSPSATPAAGRQDGEAARAVVRRYAAAIAAGRYRDARALWAGGGARSGLSAEAFADAFSKYATFDAEVGPASDVEAGAGQRYVTVPVRVTGTLKTGGPFVLEGPVILHRVAEGIETANPSLHEWRIDRSELKPRPGEAAGTAGEP